MKKTLYILSGILTILLTIGYSIQYSSINFGSSRFTDSIGYITSNRGVKVNGNFNITGNLLQNGSAFIDTNKYLSIYRFDTTSNFYRRDTVGYFNRYNLDTTKVFYSGQNNPYGVFDSVYSLGRLRIDGYLTSGGPSIKTKLVKYKIGSSTAATYTTAHGISPYTNIISYNVMIFNDSTAVRRLIPPGYSLSTTLTFTNYFLDSTVCSIYIPVGSVNLLNDSAYFFITYHE